MTAASFGVSVGHPFWLEHVTMIRRTISPPISPSHAVVPSSPRSDTALGPMIRRPQSHSVTAGGRKTDVMARTQSRPKAAQRAHGSDSETRIDLALPCASTHMCRPGVGLGRYPANQSALVGSGRLVVSVLSVSTRANPIQRDLFQPVRKQTIIAMTMQNFMNGVAGSGCTLSIVIDT
jgi:hypothetical protein